LFLVDPWSYNATSYLKPGDLDGQESNKATCVDTRAGANFEDACSKEDKCVTDRQDAKANSGRNAAKGV
jgi:hypothetical protein